MAHLRVQQAEAAGHVDVETQLFQFGAVDRGHVDSELDDAARQEIDQKLGCFAGHAGLGFHGGGAEMRRHHNVGQLQEWMIAGRRLFHEDVQRRAGDMTGTQGVGERLLVDDAASCTVQDPRTAWQQRQPPRVD